MDEELIAAAIERAKAELRRQFDEGKPGPYFSEWEGSDEAVIDGDVDLRKLVLAILGSAR